MKRTTAKDRVIGAPRDLPVLVFFERAPGDPELILLAVGDTGFCGRPARLFGPEGSEPLFHNVREMLSSADGLFVNFEGSLADESDPGRHFAMETGWAQVLATEGVTVANLANNHSIDHGGIGLRSTVEALKNQGICVLGAGFSAERAARPVIQQVGDLRLGWLAAGRTGSVGASDRWVINELDPDELVAGARKVADQVDCLIVSIHCGFMWLDYPDPAIRKLAHRLTDVGADLVLMHHPHVIQGVEVTEDGSVICYSLGNFLFDSKVGNIQANLAGDLEREGGIFVFGIDRDGVASALMIPTEMDDQCCLRWPPPERAHTALDRIIRISRDLETVAGREGFYRQRAQRNTGHGIKTVWVFARTGQFRTLCRELMKIRPQHVRMLLRWALGKVGVGKGR